MTEAPTPPAVSEALREAVARFIGEGRALASAEYHTDRLLSPESPIASEIARLTGENALLKWERDEDRKRASLFIARAEAAEAETARLRAALEDAADALGWAEVALREDSNDAAGVTLSAANNARAALTGQEQADG